MYRREYLYSLGATLGSVAFQSLLAQESGSKTTKGPHLAPRARRCVFLTMEGGPSHIDTFEPKPALKQLHLKEFQRQDVRASAMASGKRYYVESPFAFNQHGESGAWMCDQWKHLPKVADHLCFYHGMQAESVNHPTALYHINTGNRFGGDPAIGAWVNYGLGTLNENLPGFVVLPELSYPQGGAANWGNGYLPAQYQATALRPQGSPILNLSPIPGVTADHQRENLDLLSRLNRAHLEDHPQHELLAARLESFELAYRMQDDVRDVLDLASESEQTLENYGLNNSQTQKFGRKCLFARRLLESGVRFVQLYAGTWDSHDYIAKAHSQLIAAVDQPIAALIQDLHQRGLLEDTLIVWCGEFGRSPDNGVRGGIAYGRDHNADAMCVWLAGGGIKAGSTVGASDELGAKAVECVHPIRDLHVTLLHLLGLDDNRLTYYHAGRFKQLSQFGGQVITELLA
ncbi:MAG: DUF1501 domain-containing protein [Planctomycetales bacterium]|nr:DUF1501 domain-containing protein [Planctomycetales bacterium]